MNDVIEMTVNVPVTDEAGVHTMLLRLKRMLLRGNQYRIAWLMTNWYQSRSCHVAIPVAITDEDDSENLAIVRSEFDGKGSMGQLTIELVISGVELHLSLLNFAGGVIGNDLLWLMLERSILHSECVPFSDDEIVGEMMEFVYDYSDYKEMVDE
jgi:hypothetical protein